MSVSLASILSGFAVRVNSHLNFSRYPQSARHPKWRLDRRHWSAQTRCAGVHIQQGSEYYDAGEYDQAIAEFQEAIQLDPEFAYAYLGLGYSYALGPRDWAKATEALETYLRLMPDAENRAQVEADIQEMHRLANDPIAGIQIPEGKALFYFRNYTGQVWQIDIGPYFLEVPPRQPDQEVNIGTIFVDPGNYTWSAHSLDNYYLVDEHGNKAFEITLGPGDSYGSGCCR